jgi:hypothetical protein
VTAVILVFALAVNTWCVLRSSLSQRFFAAISRVMYSA